MLDTSGETPKSGVMRAPQRKIFRALLVCFALFLAAQSLGQTGGFYYTVQSRDSMSTIAGRFGVSTSQLAAANRLSANAKLAEGSRIWVPKSATSHTTKPSSSAGTSQKPKASTTTPRPAASQAPAPSKAKPAAAEVASSESPGSYVVRTGDSLWKIAQKHGMSAESLARANGIDPSAPLKVGQKLRIPTSQPILDVPGGGIEMASSQPREQSQQPAPAAQVDPTAAGLRPSRHGFIWPVEGSILRQYTNTSDEKHMGINIGVPKGTEVRAAKDGKVVYASDTIPFYGKMVIIGHEGGLASCYAMNDRLLVQEGQRVKRGQVIARSGDSAKGGQAYCHFEIRRNGDAVDPMPYLP